MPLAYVVWRAGTTFMVVVPVRQAGNRFLGFLKGLQIRAQEPIVTRHGELKLTSQRRSTPGVSCSDST